MEAKEKKHTETEDSLLLQTLGKTPKLRILDFLMDNRLFDFSKKEIIEGTGMSKATFYKYWPEIEENNLVSESRRFGKAVLYTLNEDNPMIKELIELDEKIAEQHAP